MARVHAETYSLSLHDALPILIPREPGADPEGPVTYWGVPDAGRAVAGLLAAGASTKDEPSDDAPAASSPATDRKSTRLNSSHRCISYAVFCLKKKKEPKQRQQ